MDDLLQTFLVKTTSVIFIVNVSGAEVAVLPNLCKKKKKKKDIKKTNQYVKLQKLISYITS